MALPDHGLGHGLDHPTDFAYVPGVEVLDERHGPVPPMYTPAELAALRIEEQRLFGKQ